MNAKITREQAETARQGIENRCERTKGFVSIGISLPEGEQGYAVCVMWEEEVDRSLPAYVFGVPIVQMVTGRAQPEVNYERAKAAQAVVLELCEGRQGWNGIGITKIGENYAVLVNRVSEVDTDLSTEIDGVQVIQKVIGTIRAQSVVRPEDIIEIKG